MTLPVLIKVPLLLLRHAISRFSPREDSGTGPTIAIATASPTTPAPAPAKMGAERKENVRWVEVRLRSLLSQHYIDFAVGCSWDGIFHCRGYASV